MPSPVKLADLAADKLLWVYLPQLWPRARREPRHYRTEGQGQPGSRDEVELFIEHYCRDNPGHQLFMAAAALVQETGGPVALHAFTKSAEISNEN
jgi:hypothetical protein